MTKELPCWREVMELPNVIVPGWPVEQASWLVLTGLENFIDFLHTLVRIPKNLIVMCFNLQKQLLMLPFTIASKVIITPLMHLIKLKSVPIVSLDVRTPAQMLTGERHPTPEKIIAACREIRCSSIRSVSKKQSTSQLCDYKLQLDKWKMESEKRTEEIYRIGTEDKELMKAVASGLRSLKVLKNKREMMHSNFNRSISTMISEGTVTSDKLLDLKRRMKVADADIIDRKNACLEMLSYGRLEGLADSGYSSPVKEDSLPDEGDMDLPPETMKKILGLVSEENSLLRSQLTCTLDKLEEILTLSKNINNEVATLDQKFAKLGSFNNEMESLQDKLDQERELLLTVQADRDFMRNKLKTLENLIMEEEEFLGDSRFESCFEDSESSITASLDEFDFSMSSR